MARSLPHILQGYNPLVSAIGYHLRPTCGLIGAGNYSGNLAIAGGYLRDIACRKRPKDLDIFFDADHLKDLAHAAAIGQRLCRTIEDGAEVVRTFASYGTWAEDVEGVVSIELPEATHYCDQLIPTKIDLVFLRPSQLKKYGYDGSEASFLSALCARVDLRLNAIGVSPQGTFVDAGWESDLLEKRLVVQKARLAPGQEADMKRIQRRLERLAQDKFKGWTVQYELHDGSLTPFLPSPYSVIGKL